MTTTTITKSLLESISKVVNPDSKNLTESYSYIDKKNNKASNTDQLEDLIAAELDLGGVDDEDLQNLLTHFKKGYSIAVAVGSAAKREAKKDGYVPGPFAIYKDMDERNQEIYIKAPAGMKEEAEEGKEEEEKKLDEEFYFDIPSGMGPDEFISEFDDVVKSNVGYWMRSVEAKQKLMRAAKTNNYNFTEVMLSKGKQDTKDKVVADHKAKGYNLFDYGTTSKGETGLLFYKKK